METSSVCNASCPMCPRERPNFNKKTDPTSLSLEKVKTLFNDDFIRNLDSMYMCGNYGDPAAAPDTKEIFRYFRKINNNIALVMHSNASLRTKKWWRELGSILSQPNDYCVFSIDGLKDTNHIYRVGTDFDKIRDNAINFISSGGIAHWHFMVFEHNEHQVEEAEALSKNLGFVEFHTKVSCRFNMWPKVTHIKAPMGEKYRDQM